MRKLRVEPRLKSIKLNHIFDYIEFSGSKPRAGDYTNPTAISTPLSKN